nr:hypothetical protein [Tanacetum cinerariifolium]
MLKFVSNYKVIDLYIDHSVCKEPVNVDNSVSKAIILYDPSNLDKFLENDTDEVLDDVSEDEWLQESLRKLPRFSQCGGQSSNNVDNVNKPIQAERNRTKDLVITEHVANEGNAVSDDKSESEYGSSSDDSDFIVDEENLIHDLDVDMQDFIKNTNYNVEWIGCEESVQEVNEEFYVEEDTAFEDFDSGTDLENEGVRKKDIRKLGKMTAAADLFKNSNFTFITDRQKGVIPAIAEMYVETLKEHNKEAYDWLRLIPSQHWARSHFSRLTLIILLNNMCEVLNKHCGWKGQAYNNLLGIHKGIPHEEKCKCSACY